jgi:hypothetical protein
MDGVITVGRATRNKKVPCSKQESATKKVPCSRRYEICIIFNLTFIFAAMHEYSRLGLLFFGTGIYRAAEQVANLQYIMLQNTWN